MTEHIPVALIDPNPWQPRRTMDPERLAELAESIRGHGLLQPPIGRRAGERVQLAFGHRRLAAWQHARPGEPFPMELRDLTDRQMAEHAATENASREDLNPVERALGIKRLIDDFGMSQREAGGFYGLATQGAVSNVLGILKHAPEVQRLVSLGQLSERHARDLRLIDRISRKQAIEVAAGAAKLDERDRGQFIAEKTSDLLWKQGRKFRDAAWKPSWPETPIPVDAPKPGEPAEIRQCTGCPSHFRYEHHDLCAQPACFDLKQRHGVADTLKRISAKLKIPVAAEAETVTLVFDGRQDLLRNVGHSWEVRARVKKAVQARLPQLRLVPAVGGGEYELKEVLGSSHVALAATNKAEVERWLAANGSKKAAAVTAKPAESETEAEKAKRLKREEKERAERREQRAAFLRAKHDVLWVIETGAWAIGERLAMSGGALSWTAELAHNRYHQSESAWPDFARIEAGIEREAKAGDEGARRQHIVLDVIGEQLLGYRRPEDGYDWPRAQKVIEQVAKTFGVERLPAGWNEPPIHRTDFNCWHCGRFASHPKGLTQAEVQQGWGAVFKGETTLDVTCPECSRKSRANGKPKARSNGKGGATAQAKKGQGTK